ncbi:hypothetical protein KQ875_01685 [Mycoplasma zalophi]|uniref:Variable surface lipoprotein n=1 Tax=Mycoplasma zalophi TaxID=191287 RepID=A0ABS6DRA2_9MOLU|nr:hypothetical protein [Mycoplasma zalophi]MBU4692306.1 hypothetical protein [Mycoplasma zalophi]
MLKKKFLLCAVVLSSIASVSLVTISCNNEKKTSEPVVNKNIINNDDVNRDEGLIGEELVQRVAEVKTNSTLTMSKEARQEYESLSVIQKDKYIHNLWQKIREWFADYKIKGQEHYSFTPLTLQNSEFQKKLNVYIPNLEYFVGNHNVFCYFAFSEEKRDIYFYYKIKCLDGRQTEGSGEIFLNS